MKKYMTLLLVPAISSVAGAGTMLISGLPTSVDTSGGDVVLSFDVVSNGQYDNDSIYIYTYTGATLDIASAINVINDGELYDGGNLDPGFLDAYVDITGVTDPAIWADIARPQLPTEIIGDIVSDLGLTIPQGFEGMIDVMVLSENTGVVEGMASIEVIPEPITIALLGLGGLFLRRRK